MFNTAKKAILAVALAAGMSSAASAAVLTPGTSGVLQGTGSVTSTGPADDVVGFEFDWSLTRYSAFIEFTSTKAFQLFFTGFGPSDALTHTGFVFEEVGGTRFTDDVVGPCGALALAPVAGPFCDHISGASSTATTPSAIPLFGTMAPGTYMIGISEANTPVVGSASFAAVAVPLPATALLLLGALGGLAVYRRKAAAKPALV